MADITFKDIKKAMNTLKKYHTQPAKFYCSERRAKNLMEMAKKEGIPTGNINGKDYLMGMQLVTEKNIDENTCYISET